MAIPAEHVDHDFLAMDELGRELLGLLAEGLAFLRSVDPAQTDAFGLTIVQDVDGVAVEGPNDFATKLIRKGRMDEQERKEESPEIAHEPHASRLGPPRRGNDYRGFSRTQIR